MVRATALKKRYIHFELTEEIPKDELEKRINQEALRFFGELNFHKTGIKLIEYKNKKGILRCSRHELQNILGMLALMNNPRIIVKEVSGTIAALERKTKSE